MRLSFAQLMSRLKPYPALDWVSVGKAGDQRRLASQRGASLPNWTNRCPHI
jgi:hypothetical protein